MFSKEKTGWGGAVGEDGICLGLWLIFEPNDSTARAKSPEALHPIENKNAPNVVSLRKVWGGVP